MQAWEQFLTSQEKELGEAIVQKWLRPLKILYFDACNLHLQAEDSFQIEWFEEHIRKKAQTALLNNNKRRIKIHLSLTEDSHKHPAPLKKTKKAKPKMAETSPASIFTDAFLQLDPLLTFAHFVETSSSILCRKLLIQISGLISKKPELGTYNPIFICGMNGTGKTHLLTATAKILREQAYNVAFARAETFTEHVLTAIRAGEMALFRQSYRNIDVLILDDVHLLAKKWATQEEFFHTFNTLHMAGKQIILSANCAPTELQDIEPRLTSRFEWGIVLSLDSHTDEDRRHILQNKALVHQFPLNNAVKEFLLATFVNSTAALIRALEALILRSHLHPSDASITPTQLSVPTVQRLLSDLIQEEENRALSSEKIILSVAEHFGIRSEDILGKAQSRDCVLPRQIAMYLCRNRLKMPFTHIGEAFSRDHSTVMSSIKRIQKDLEQYNTDIGSHLHAIQKKITNMQISPSL